MMNFIIPCMTWVPILWGKLCELSNKRAVENFLRDPVVVNEPQPNILVVDKSLSDLHNLKVVDNHLSDLLAIDTALGDHPTVDDHFSDIREIDSQFPNLPAVDNLLLDLVAVEDFLLDLQAVDHFPDLTAVQDPLHDLVTINDPPFDIPVINVPLCGFSVVDDSLSDLSKVNGPLLKLQTIENPFVKFREVDNCLPDLSFIDNSLSDLPVVFEPLPDLSTVVDPPHDVLVIDDPLPCLSAVGNPLLYKPMVDDPHPDPLVVDGPLLHLPEVDNPVLDVLAVDDPSNLPVIDTLRPSLPTNDPYLDLQSVNDPLPDLPYHIITDILSRLPAKCIFQCQCVSRLLYLLTTTSSFTRSHLNQGTSVIVMQPFKKSIRDCSIDVYFKNEGAGMIEVKSMDMDFCCMSKDRPVILFGSYDGFLLFRTTSIWEQVFYIWNPITDEQVTLTSPLIRKKTRITPLPHLYVCGFYYHDRKRKYEVIYFWNKGWEYEFHVLTLGTKAWRNVGTCSYPPSCDRPPVIIDGTLYWMVDLERYWLLNDVYPSRSDWILSFKIETEEFFTMEYCGHVTSCSVLLDQMHLLEMDGELYLCDPLSETEIDLWVLNSTTKSWIKRYILTPPMFFEPTLYDCGPNNFFYEVVHIKKGELLVRTLGRLFLYNLDTSTCRMVEEKGFKNTRFRAMVHRHSLVSLHTGRFISLRRSPAARKRRKGARK